MSWIHLGKSGTTPILPTPCHYLYAKLKKATCPEPLFRARHVITAIPSCRPCVDGPDDTMAAEPRVYCHSMSSQYSSRMQGLYTKIPQSNPLQIRSTEILWNTLSSIEFPENNPIQKFFLLSGINFGYHLRMRSRIAFPDEIRNIISGLNPDSTI
jgi:hypothetical protein